MAQKNPHADRVAKLPLIYSALNLQSISQVKPRPHFLLLKSISIIQKKAVNYDLPPFSYCLTFWSQQGVRQLPVTLASNAIRNPITHNIF